MDFGFGSFLDKFEEYFGRLATRCLLLMIGLAVTATCISLIGNYVIEPIYRALSHPGMNLVLWHNLGGLFSPLLTLLLVVIGGLVLSSNIIRWKESWQIRKLRVTLRKREEIFRDMESSLEKSLSRAERSNRETSDILALAHLTLEDILAHAVEQEIINQEQVELILSLRDIGSETPP